MGLFKKNGGLMDEIRCDEPSYLIWKWHPRGSEKGKNTRENAIRFGSSLRVKDGEVAVFVYQQKDGTVEDYIVGPFDEIVSTKNLPILAGIVGLAYDGGTPFPAEIYFINLARIVQVKFAVPYFDVYDPRFTDFGVPTAVRGTISFQIKDYKEFIKLHRLSEFNLEDFEAQIRDAVIRYAKEVVANVPAESQIPLIQIETKISMINEKIEMKISDRLKEDFGVVVSGVDVGTIEFDQSSEGYQQLLNVTKGVTEATIKAETEAKVKNIADRQRIEMENYEATLKIQREEGQYAQHKQTQSNHLGAYQIESQTEVGVAGANALGKMGENGSGNVDLGSNGTGFNPASMMAGMALGGAVGQNLANTMNGVMNNKTTNQANTVIPPIPKTKYYLVKNEEQCGPFDKSHLKELVDEGTLKKDTLMWKDGMEDWARADSIEEIKELFPNIPPIPENKE